MFEVHGRDRRFDERAHRARGVAHEFNSRMADNSRTDWICRAAIAGQNS